MHQITRAQKIISLLLKAVIIISAAVGTILSAYAGRNSFMGGSTVFMFFTIQSNISLALISAVGIFFLLRRNDIPNLWYIIRFIGAISITLTGAVFSFVLAPTMGDAAWNMQNTLTHVVVPVVSVIDFFLTGINGNIRKRASFLVIIPPIIYAVYAGIGYVLNWQFAEGINYPYFFLNWGSPAGAFGFTDELPYMGCGWWIIALFAALIAAGFIYLFIIDILKKIVYKSE